jgi:heme-degrading monooxygenase HmoA
MRCGGIGLPPHPPVSRLLVTGQMIMRSWSGRATPEGADAYVTHFRHEVLPHLQRIQGHRGALLVRRSRGLEVEVMVLTFWDSMAAVHAFTGADATMAVVEPEARAVLKEFDHHGEHFDVVLDTRT